MNPEKRANEILKHSHLYKDNPIFKHMVDATIYLTQEQKEISAKEVDVAYGVTAGKAGYRETYDA